MCEAFSHSCSHCGAGTQIIVNHIDYTKTQCFGFVAKRILKTLALEILLKRSVRSSQRGNLGSRVCYDLDFTKK
jgi:hypothetical protein